MGTLLGVLSRGERWGMLMVTYFSPCHMGFLSDSMSE